MAQAEASEASQRATSEGVRGPRDDPQQEPAADSGPKKGGSPSRKKSKKKKKQRRRVLAAFEAVGLLVLGGLIPPTVAWIYGRIDKATVDAPAVCKDAPQLLPNDHGVSSDVRLLVRPSTTSGCFMATRVDLLTGQDFSGFIEWTNRTSKREDNVSIKLALPDGLSVVPGTSVFVASNHPKGAKFSDGIATSGLNVGSYAPGGNFYIQFDLHFTAPASMRCGTNRFAIFGYRVAFRGPELNESVPLTYLRAC